MGDRTEEDKIIQAGIEVILGGEKYVVRPLVIRDSREWRKSVVDLIATLPKYADVTTDTPDQFGDALKALLVAVPDSVANLFFRYAKDLNKEEIEGKATDAELAKAFEQVIEIAFPLVQSLTKTMTKLAR